MKYEFFKFLCVSLNKSYKTFQTKKKYFLRKLGLIFLKLIFSFPIFNLRLFWNRVPWNQQCRNKGMTWMAKLRRKQVATCRSQTCKKHFTECKMQMLDSNKKWKRKLQSETHVIIMLQIAEGKHKNKFLDRPRRLLIWAF